MSIAYTDVHTGRRENEKKIIFCLFHNMPIVVVPFPTFLFCFITSEKGDGTKTSGVERKNYY